jgi:integrase
MAWFDANSLSPSTVRGQRSQALPQGFWGQVPFGASLGPAEDRRRQCSHVCAGGGRLRAVELRLELAAGRGGQPQVAGRPVPLNVVAMLRRHRTAQNEERMRAGHLWVDSGPVFTTELGGQVDPRNLLRVLEAAAKVAKIEGVGVHTLRHSAAASWLESGVHIKAVADLLGHSSIAITDDVCGHTSDNTARAAVDGLATRLGL